MLDKQEFFKRLEKMNFVYAENYISSAQSEKLSWSHFNDNVLVEIETGREIYQGLIGTWGKMVPITDDLLTSVRDFWKKLEEEKERFKESKRKPCKEIKRPSDWCPKCESCCYGDCGL